MRRAGLALVGVLATGLLWSCAGSSTHSGNGGTGPVSEGDLVQKVADAICGNLGGCCAAVGIPYDRAGCESFVLAELELNPPPNTTWDSVAAGKCVDWFARIASSCAEAEDGDAVCGKIYRGTLPEGAACSQSEECADIRGSEASCTFDDISVSGRCGLEIEPPHGRRGDACIGTCIGNGCSGFVSSGDGVNTVCHLDDRLICSTTLAVCVPAPVAGETCDDFYCAAGAYCSNLEFICQATKPDGQACEFDEQCTRGSCADFLCGPRTIASPELCTGQ